MRSLILILSVLFVSSVGLADPSASPLPLGAVAGPSLIQIATAWVMAHQVIVGGFLAASLDLVFALNEKWKSNGTLHWLYLFARSKAGMDAPAA